MIKGKLKYDELDIKRFYLPGLILKAKCRSCEEEYEIELDRNYPYNIDEIGNGLISHCCPECDAENCFNVQLNITLTVL